jgi:hypothetical protein
MTLPAFDTRLFQIATKPLDPADWLDPDADMAAQLAEKARLHQTHLSQIFAELPESRLAQAELLSLLADYLPERFPHLWQRVDAGLLVVPNGEVVELNGIPLLQAAKLVQDDLLILSRSEPELSVLLGAARKNRQGARRHSRAGTRLWSRDPSGPAYGPHVRCPAAGNPASSLELVALWRQAPLSSRCLGARHAPLRFW